MRRSTPLFRAFLNTITRLSPTQPHDFSPLFRVETPNTFGYNKKGYYHSHNKEACAIDLRCIHRDGVTFFACDAPQWQGANHGFSTRLCGVSRPPFDSLNLGANRGDLPEYVTENFHRFQRAIGAQAGDPLVKNHQVHGALVRRVTHADAIDDLSLTGNANADALVTDEPGLCLSAFSADCIPILYYDPHRRVVAAAHAGWRGTAQGVAAATVETMVHHYGCDPSQILCAIGPGISSCCFETHRDVPDALRAALGIEAANVIFPLPEGKFRVDLKQANLQFLLRAGLQREHVAVSELCTACHPELFWSHRILGNQRGSMAALIQLSTESSK